ncbi:MAG: V-type ATPase subunit [Candidatus Omnitrophica bacterium]|nr:V-type ATPase subunit [Candidatus Omnitrophota bacterium]
MRQLAKYAFANAKIRAMLSYLLTAEDFNGLLEARDLEDALDILKKTRYSSVLEHIPAEDNNIVHLEREFLKNDLAVYQKVENTLSGKGEREFVSLLRQRYELEEIKVFLRIWHQKLTVSWEDYVVAAKICFDIDFKKLLSASSIEEFILLLDHTPYKAALLAGRERYKERNSSFYLEASLDLDYYRRLLACIEKFTSVDKSVARRILGIEVDMENINWLIRLRKYYALGIGEMLEWFIPGGQWINKEAVRKYYVTDGLTKVVESVSFGPYAKIKELAQENVALVENFLYEILLHQVRSALSGFPFTIGTVMGYLILKRQETKNIISLLNAKQYGWRKEEITPLLNI